MPPKYSLRMRVLVTGGAGYIGSHAVRALLQAGHEVEILDDLSSGHADTVPTGVTLHRGDVTAPGVLAGAAERAQAILHFAARIQVGESVARPELYWSTNVGGMLRVIEVASARKIPVVFSSTAAVYGEPKDETDRTPIRVDRECRPANPYGMSKWIGEQMLRAASRAHGFGAACLRYFNAAGCDVAAGLGERHDPETHLIPLAINAALGKGKPLALFGDDWPTPDGTCVRDYVHVIDLADAHVRALDRIGKGGFIIANLGGGRGTTVREVLDAVERASGRAVPHTIAPRRDGDVASLVADVSVAEKELGWTPKKASIDQIVADALAVIKGSR
jgi:UDP-glucose-4-epimerase GalE